MTRSRPAFGPRRFEIGLLVLLLLLPLPGVPRSQEPAGAPRSRVEAAFLRNFARYVTWPVAAFPGERSPWSICILGEDHFGDALEQTFQGRTEQGRPFTVQRAGTLEQLPECQIVFIGHESAARRRAVLEALKHRPVLTVGHASEFLHEGGIIRLRAGERIEMSINLDRARAASLVIPSKMLEVSAEVIENGSPRRWR